MKLAKKPPKSTELAEFTAYYRSVHATKTPAGRILGGNAKQFLRDELNYIISHGKISTNFDAEIKNFRASRRNKPEIDDEISLLVSHLGKLTTAQKKELLKIISA